MRPEVCGGPDSMATLDRLTWHPPITRRQGVKHTARIIIILSDNEATSEFSLA